MTENWHGFARTSGYQVRAEIGFALSSLSRVVESHTVRAARPFWVTGALGVP